MRFWFKNAGLGSHKGKHVVSSLLESDVPESFASGGEPTSQPGRSKGLVVLLDSHSDVLSAGSVDSDFDGFLGVINPSGSFPFTSYSGFDIRPGDLTISVVKSTCCFIRSLICRYSAIRSICNMVGN